MKNRHHKQRRLYKFLESISLKNYKNETELLGSIIKEVCENEDFEIVGGRIWRFSVDEKGYKLIDQFGSVKTIPENYTINADDKRAYEVMKKLYKKRTLMEEETDRILKDSGVKRYSMTGVGDILKTQYGKFYEYALGFNAEEFSEEFFESISVISSVSTVAIRNMGSLNQQKMIEKDYKKASEIQQNILPEHYTEFLDYQIFGTCIPDSAVGGDYFDYITNTDNRNDEETLSIVISDAASKGLAAAIQSLFVSGALRMGMAFASRMSHILGSLNHLIHKTFPYDRFVTLFMCELTRSQNRMILYSNAGHCSPIHYRVEKDDFIELLPTGGLLGVVDNQKFGVENVRMHKGDVLLLYTDGISEAQDVDGNLFGEDRIKELIKKYHELPPKEIVLNILDDIMSYSSVSGYTDDKTLVCIKRTEQELLSS